MMSSLHGCVPPLINPDLLCRDAHRIEPVDSASPS